MNDSDRGDDGRPKDAPARAVPSGGAGFVWGRKPRAQDDREPVMTPTDGPPDVDGSTPENPVPVAPVPGDPVPGAPVPENPVPGAPVPPEVPLAPTTPTDPERVEPRPDEPVPDDPAPLEVPLVSPPAEPSAPLGGGSSARQFPPPPVLVARQDPPAAANIPEAPEQSIPTMEQVLDAPSPRRAAREAAAREAAARDAGRMEADPEGDAQTSTPEEDAPSDSDRGAALSTSTARRDADPTGIQLNDRESNDGGSDASSSRSSPTAAGPADGAAGIESLFGDTTPDPAPAGRDAGAPPMDAPASEWAASLRSATMPSESAPPATGSTTPARAPMTSVQRTLFWLLGIVIVVAIVILIVLLTTQQAGASVLVDQVAGVAVQSTSTS